MESKAIILINRLRQALNHLLNRFVSVPIFIKLIGTGVFVILIFGAVVLYRTRVNMARTLYDILEQQTHTIGHMTASYLERPLSVKDYLAATLILEDVNKIYPNILYGIVEDRSNRILAHTFKGNVPPDLVGLRSPAGNPNKEVEVFGSAEGFVVEAAIPILKGTLGRLRLGTSDRLIRQELSNLTWLLLGATIFCAALGLGLAVILTYLVTRPIQNLLFATNKISQGDFASRARVFWEDEIGRLAVAFNHMAENLQKFRCEVEEKEATRQALLEKIIFIQEEERRRIAQDLHDQIGQSLSVLLMDIQSMGNNPQCLCEKHHMIQKRASELIDEVRQLAWGMHPAILDDYGLDKALARYIDTISKATKIDIDYQSICSPGLTRLPLRTEVALYRIAQEAITNIARHAGTKQASVVLMRNEQDTALLIEDAGQGFDPAAARNNDFTHMGLIGMRERTSMLGGELTVESAPGKGTTIRVKISKEMMQ